MNRRLLNFLRFIIILFITTGYTFSAFAQDNGSRLRISLLTVEPGEELYSTFGHSAIRVIDSNSVTDVIYNYGTFDFDTPDFYLKFIRGKLMYFVSAEYYSDFIASNEAENRGTTEQVLNLQPLERKALRDALYENLQEENKFYLYDFFLDNCTTRLRDLIEKYKKPTPVLPAVMPATTTFRQAIHLYLRKNKKYWSTLGIDLLLGAPTDAVMTTSQQQFLPDNLMYALDSSKNVQVVKKKIPGKNYNKTNIKWQLFTPLVCSILILLFYLLLVYFAQKRIVVKNILVVSDGLLFFITGALGCLLFFMMFATDHSMTKQNYNIIWAFPGNIIFCFLISLRKKWVGYYFLGYSILMTSLLLTWFFLPQQLNMAFMPIAILLLLRSYARGKLAIDKPRI